MDEDQIAAEFETHRAHLHAVAQRLLSSPTEADDAVQEAWLRLHRTGSAEVTNLGGWLTTVVARVSLDMLRARAARRVDGDDGGADRPAGGPSPEQEVELADAVGTALLVVLDTLSPAERLAFVLHDTFAVPFEEIGAILGRSPSAAKQLASRARFKVRSAPAEVATDQVRQRAVVDAFLAAARNADFDGLIALLHPDVALHADAMAVKMGAPALLERAPAVAGMFSGRAQGAQAATIDGAVGMVWIVGGIPKVAWDVAIEDGRIVHIDMLATPDTLAGTQLVEVH